MRVMLTGCNGQVGSSIVKLISKDFELHSFDRESLDITNKAAVNKVISELKPGIVVNAAAFTAVDKAEQEVDLCFAINRDGPQYLAQAANENGAAFIHISTDYVFSGNKDNAYYEDDETAPINIYGQSKLEGEQSVMAANANHLILRTSWVFSEYGHNFVKTMLRLADKSSLNIVNDQVGGPTYAGDIASTIITILHRIKSGGFKSWGIYHFSGKPYVSWFQFAESIFDIAIKDGLIKAKPELHEIPTSSLDNLATRPLNSRLSNSKIFNEFSIKPSDWKENLKNIKCYK